MTIFGADAVFFIADCLGQVVLVRGTSICSIFMAGRIDVWLTDLSLLACVGKEILHHRAPDTDGAGVLV
jgi:hypothetical protein